ncbi:hypothetical protein VNI00_016343 [Paramarasmius palmivorus]|uniref:Uncharacterized protein n=1 Tax=Paramarasmius palmivorus TaxID=297713 RepID=A0AAW0BFA9_9AGAR
MAVQASLALPLEQLLPPELPFETPPTPIELANSMNYWVKWNLKKAILADPHYENSLYGPDNTFISEIFPTRRWFSVVPQGLIRRAFKMRKNINPLNISTSSTGATHWSRHSKARKLNSKKLLPDFLVVKVIPTDIETPRQHYVSGVFEIKLGEPSIEEDNMVDKGDNASAGEDTGNSGTDEDTGNSGTDKDTRNSGTDEDIGNVEADEESSGVEPESIEVPVSNLQEHLPYSLRKAIAQMHRYMKAFIQHPNRDPELEGYLLVGDMYVRFTIQGDLVIRDEPRDMFAEGDPFTLSLCSIASRHWNRKDLGPIEAAGLENL